VELLQISDELICTYGEPECQKFLHIFLLETQAVTQ